jgi:ribonuclease HI
MKLFIHTDGGARGNPGPAAVGVVIEEEIGTGKKEIAAFGRKIGKATNNVAEYQGVSEAFLYLKILNPKSRIQNGEQLIIHFFLDSILVVNQLNGLYKVKDARLRELLSGIRILEQEVGGDVSYTSVPREQNIRADYFVNQALDSGNAYPSRR